MSHAGCLRRASRSASRIAAGFAAPYKTRRTNGAAQGAGGARFGHGQQRRSCAAQKGKRPSRRCAKQSLRQRSKGPARSGRTAGWRDRCFLACAGSVACAGTMSTRVAVPYRRQRGAHAPTAGRPPTRAAHMQCGVRAPRRIVPLRIAAARWPGCSGMDFGILRRTRVHSRLPHRQTVQNPLRPSRHVWWRPSQLKFLPAGSAVMRYGCRFGRNGAPEWQFVITFIIVYSLYS